MYSMLFSDVVVVQVNFCTAANNVEAAVSIKTSPMTDKSSGMQLYGVDGYSKDRQQKFQNIPPVCVRFKMSVDSAEFRRCCLAGYEEI